MSQRKIGSKYSLQRLIETRYQPTVIRQQVLIKQQQKKRQRLQHQKHQNNDKYWKGIHNGRFYRIPKVSTTTSGNSSASSLWRPLPVLPKLYTPMSPPAKIPSLLQQPKTTSSSSSSSCETASAAPATATTTCATKSSSSSSIIPAVVKAAAKTFRHSNKREEFYERLKQWMYDNYGTLILNFGSICTLIGFTRSDVLELRYLSVTGSVCAIAYHFATPPLRIPPMLWSSTFAFVNGYKIYEIVQEREGSVQLSTEQEEMYIHFFMPHGVTPKQFEIIYAKAEVLHIKKGTYLIRQTEAFQHVDLVVAGTTRASALGRFLTAASTTPTARDERVGGASGAWIGEMCLLERVWMKEQKSNAQQNSSIPQNRRISKSPSKEVEQKELDSVDTSKEAATNFTDIGNFEGNHNNKATASNKSAPSANNVIKTETIENNSKAEQESNGSVSEKIVPLRKSTETQANQQQRQPSKLKACQSMYTIVAQEDCIVLRWRHDVMEGLMEKSTDMRAALTRAMTAAIVGKVINFTVSRSKANQTWATWLGDWKYNAGAEITIDDENHTNATTSSSDATKANTNTVMVDSASLSNKENLPNYPIRTFR